MNYNKDNKEEIKQQSYNKKHKHKVEEESLYIANHKITELISNINKDIKLVEETYSITSNPEYTFNEKRNLLIDLMITEQEWKDINAMDAKKNIVLCNNTKPK